MLSGWDIVDIIALLTAVGSLIGMLSQQRKNKAEVAAMINETYNDLCAQLQNRIRALHEDIVRAEERIAILEKENRELKQALVEAVEAKERLQKEVDELSERLAVYENKPARTRMAK